MPKPKRKPNPNYVDISLNTSGNPVSAAYSKLGPVNNFTDLLTNSTEPDTKLAALQIIHALEAWRFLSSATNAYLINSKASTIHFAYYAQLRSAFSLFANSGIYSPGIAYDKHGEKINNYYLNIHNRTVPIKNPESTHSMAWKLWAQIIKRPDCENLTLKNIRLLPAVTLNEIKTVVPYYTSITNINFGLDLANLANDHKARNTASYSPYWLVDPLEKMQSTNVKLVADLWGLLMSNGITQGFDATLIQHVVQKSIFNRALTPAQIEAKRVEIAKKISVNTGGDESTIYRYLQIDTSVSPILDLVESTDTKAENVLCRAFYLAYLATLAVKQNLNNTSILSAKTWIENWLEHAGIWNITYGFSRIDLQQEYQLSLDEFSTFTTSTNLPEDLWSGSFTPSNLSASFHTSKIARPEASMAWALP
jgi:hypothetical protein